MTQSKDEVAERVPAEVDHVPAEVECLPPEDDELPAEAERVPPELNSLISEAVLRARVQEIMGAAPPKSRFRKVIDHQVFTLVLGILLTFGFGTVLAKLWEDQRLAYTQQIEQERRKKEALIAAFNDFLGTLSEQRAHSLLVDHAIQQEAPIGELTNLLHNEQEVFAKSQHKAMVLEFTLRESSSPEIQQRIHNAIENGLTKPLDEAMRLHAFIFYQLSNHSKAGDWKNLYFLTDRVAACGTAVTDAVWYNTMTPVSTDQDFTVRKEESIKYMDEICKR